MAAPSQQAPPPGPGLEEGDRPRPLTEAEKKANHIASEQKRRQAIREGFDRLSEIVPGLKGQARSEALVLKKTLDFARQLMQERKALIEELDALGEHVDSEIRLSLEMLPPGWLEAGSGDNAARSTKSASLEESSEVGGSDQANGAGSRSQAGGNEAGTAPLAGA